MAFQSADPVATSPSPYALHGAAGTMAPRVGGQPQRLLPEHVEEDLRRGFKRLGGAGLVMLAIAAWASLLTWSFDDPTLTRSSALPVMNMLGTPGAVLSDVLLRTIGLAAAFAMLPLVIWGGTVAMRRPVARLHAKLVLWIAGTLGLAGGMSAFPLVQAWRIPHGYGGFVGDIVLAVTGRVLGIVSSANGATMATILLIVGGAAALFAAMGAGREELAMIWYGEGWHRDAGAAVPSSISSNPGSPITIGAPPAPGPTGFQRSPGTSLIDLAARFWRHRPGRTTPNLARPMPQHPLTPGNAAPMHAAATHAPAALYPSYSMMHQPMHSGRPFPQPQPMQHPMAHQPHAHGWPAPGPHAAQAILARGFAPAPSMQASAPASTQAPVQAPAWPPQAQPAHAAAFSGEPDALSMAQSDPESRAMAARFAPPHLAQQGIAQELDRPIILEEPELPLPAVLASPVRSAASQASTPSNAAASPAAKPQRSLLASWRARGGGLDANGAYRAPSLDMLKRAAQAKPGPEYSQNVQRGVAKLLEDVLLDFGIKGQIIGVKPGPVVTLYELEPARGIKSSRIVGLSDDIARSMSATSARVAGIPGRNVIGIELPNMRRETVFLREVLESEPYTGGTQTLPIVLGKGIGGEPIVADLARMPHVLVAGTTGSGKSVGINAMILSLLYRLPPDRCRFLMIDPKMLELSVYNGIPHLLAPVITDASKAVAALNWVVREMEERYKRMAQLAVRNIEVFNARIRQAAEAGEELARTVQTGFDPETGAPVYETEQIALEAMPYIVVVVDEMADLMLTAGKDIEGAVQRLAQMARAAGIHLIMATQRPSVDVITGTIKANFPTRISFKVTSKIDSRTILGEQGAEQLLGAGDMLFSTGTGQIVRVHGPFVADEEVEQIAAYLRTLGEPAYVDGIGEDAEDEGGESATSEAGESEDIYDKAVAIVLRDRKASTSYIQRRLSIGYNRAASIMERMEQEGLVSPANSVGKRNILVT